MPGQGVAPSVHNLLRGITNRHLAPRLLPGEDLKKIQAGTWVGWKKLEDTAAAGGPLFVRDAFYNFLCPQCPRAV